MAKESLLLTDGVAVLLLLLLPLPLSPPLSLVLLLPLVSIYASLVLLPLVAVIVVLLLLLGSVPKLSAPLLLLRLRRLLLDGLLLLLLVVVVLGVGSVSPAGGSGAAMGAGLYLEAKGSNTLRLLCSSRKAFLVASAGA
jgi:hypothetical protein